MKLSEVLAAVEKVVDVKVVEKKVAEAYLMPELEKCKQKLLSKEWDLLPQTDIENELLAKAIDMIMAKIREELA